MITFTSLGSHGRLGNQFFQYAFLIGVSKKYNLQICLPDLNAKVSNNQTCLLNSFNIEYKPLNFNNIKYFCQEIELKSNSIFNTYNPQNIENIHSGTDFLGLYQSYKYWIDYKDEVKKQFTVKSIEILDTAKNKINELKKQYNKPIIAVHLRRGDVTQYIDYNEYKKYLSTVLKNIKDSKNCFYYIFTGGSADPIEDKKDIEWVKDFYKELPYFEVCQTGNPILDFALIQECDQIVLGYISTFAWWAAFLSEKPTYVPQHFNINSELRLNYYPETFNIC